MKLVVTVFLFCGFLAVFGACKAQEQNKKRKIFRRTLTPPEANCSCGYPNVNFQAPGNRIVGGDDASVNEFPFMTALVYEDNPAKVICGGAIITSRHVLTASHCTPKRRMSGIFAEHNTESLTESVTVMISVEKFVSHENFNKSGSSDNDIAVALMAKEIPFSKTIAPVCFPGVGLQEDLVGEKVRIIGWGHVYYDGYRSDILQKIYVSVVPLKKCDAVYYAIDERIICTYTLNKDACQGDSGGPVVLMNPQTKRYTIVGVVSRGIGCGEPDTPAVNSNVSTFRNWILQKLAETDPTAATCAEI